MDRGRVKSTTGLNLRSKPNGNRVGVLKYDEQFTILDEVRFYRVKTETGEVGYVHSDYVEKLVSDTHVASQADGPPQWSPKFKAVTYTNEVFQGEKIRVDKDFVVQLDKVANYAKQVNVKIWVTSSLRQLNNQVEGAIVPPAGKSCHHVGHAIDMNVVHQGTFYNSKKLRKNRHDELPPAVLDFINLIREDKVLRWGGDFRVQDPVHIDDNLYNKERILYLAKLNSRVEQLNG